MKPQLNLKKPASKSSSVLEGIKVIKEKGKFSGEGLGGPVVEIEEDLRWASGGNRRVWVGRRWRRMPGVTGGSWVSG